MVFRKRVIPRGWDLKSIGSLTDTGSGGTPLSTKKEFYESGNIPWINSGEIGQVFIKNSKKFITTKGLENSSAKVFPKSTVLVALYGATAGRVSMLDIDASTNQAVCGIYPNENFNSLFLKYYLDTLYNHLVGVSTGSARDNLSQDVIKKLEIPFPKICVQNKIAKILFDIDSKIELNNKINAELESMAKLMYDYWFVQFDFPDKNGDSFKTSGGKMIYNEELKREIPEGWAVKRIDEVLNTDLGGTPSTKIEKYWNGEFPWLNSGEIANFPIIESELKVTESGISNSATTLMPKGTCVLSITRHLRPSILGVNSCANQSVVGLFESDQLKSSYIYPYLVNEIPRLMSLRTGAQQPHINKGIVDESFILVPEESILNNYYTSVNSMYDKIINNAFQNQRLVELRDWLLPMLMNGQVRVK